MSVLEVPYPVVLTLQDVHQPFMMSPVRRANYRFGLAEAAWILSGSSDAQLIGKFNKNMLNFSDDGHTLWGAYGPRLMGQLEHVISTLKRDPSSRQAVVTTWRPMVPHINSSHDCSNGHIGYKILQSAGIHTESDVAVSQYDDMMSKGPPPHPPRPEWDGYSWRSKDVPCTVAWHFQLRQGRLSLTVFMRSNDAWLGLPYDLLSFTTVQRVVASVLGVEPGQYHHVASNLHLYRQHWGLALQVLEENAVPDDPIKLPPFWPAVFNGVDNVRDIFKGILDGDCVGRNSLTPFEAAVNRHPTVWYPHYRDLMRANGRGRTVKKA